MISPNHLEEKATRSKFDLGMFRKVVVVAMLVAWMFLVTANYFIVHKPFTLVNALALLGVVGDLVSFALFFLLAAAIGNRLMASFNSNFGLERIILSTGLGLGLLSFIIFALGLVGELHSGVFYGAMLIGFFVFRKDARVVISILRSLRLTLDSRFEKFLVIFVSAAIFLALIRTVTPPLAWDAQLYHLGFGKYWIAQGQISAPPDNPLFSYPGLMENLYMGALLLKSDTLAQVIHWGFFLLTLGTTFLIARQYFSTRVGWISIALLAAIPSFVLVASWAYVEAALAFYVTASLFCVLRATDETPDGRGVVSSVKVTTGARNGGNVRHLADPRTAWMILGGAFSGLALGVKYTAAIVPLALAVLILLRGLNRRSLLHLLQFALAAAIVASPWYLRNWFFQGNPFYPFIFGGPFWDSFRSEQFARIGSGLVQQPLRLLLAPWDATVNGQEGALGYEATIGPLLLMLIPFLFLRRHRATRTTGRLLIFSGILYVFWLLGVAESKLLWQTRFFFPAFPAIAIVAAVGLEASSEFDLSRFSISRFAILLTAVLLVLTLLGQFVDLVALNPLPHIIGFESREQYLARRLTPEGYYRAMQSLSTLPPKAKVLFLWEPRSYYAAGVAQVVPDALLDRFGDLVFRYREPSEIASALREQGYTHILLNRSGLNYLITSQYDPVSSKEISDLDELLIKYFRRVSGPNAAGLEMYGSPAGEDSGGYELYQMVGTEF